MQLGIRPLFTAALLFLLLPAADSARAENWPQWRGANNDGLSSERGIPASWGREQNIVWRVPLPGPAGATPVVWGKRIFLTSVDGDRLLLLCIGTDGRELWRRDVGEGNKDVRGDEGNSAAPSPSTDGRHVWATMANGLLACYSVEGEPVWKLDLGERYGPLKIAFGMTSTPVLDKGRLYLQLIHGEGDANTREAMVVALDAATGDEIWRRGRPSDAIKECEHSYASPMLYRDGEREFLLSHGADYIVAHDLADGREIWRCGGLNPKGRYEPTLRFVASPLAVPGMIVVPSAKNGPVLALKPDLSGNVTDDDSAYHWRMDDNTPDVPSPLVVDGLAYLCRENGNLICLDAKTGERLYEERTTPDRHRASPVYADGKVYTTARKGVVTVVKAGRDFEIIAQNDLGEEISASPAVSGGRIYLRTFDALWAIGEK